MVEIVEAVGQVDETPNCGFIVDLKEDSWEFCKPVPADNMFRPAAAMNAAGSFSKELTSGNSGRFWSSELVFWARDRRR